MFLFLLFQPEVTYDVGHIDFIPFFLNMELYLVLTSMTWVEKVQICEDQQEDCSVL